MSAAPNHRKKYRATVGDRTIELELGREDVVIDGEVRCVSTARLAEGRVSLIIDGRSLSADVYLDTDGQYVVHVEGQEFVVSLQTERDLLLERFGLAETTAAGHRQIRAPMPGLVLTLHVEEGSSVQAGDAVLVLEAMKMENELRAPHAGTVTSVLVAKGDAVGKNELLVEIEA